jgi:catechol 2,3-dioxygenase-like lactoylglutathione lyase family enzyme
MLNAAKVVAMVGTVRPEQAKDFYQNVLGLDFVSEDQFALVFAGKNAHIRVSRVPAVAPAPYAVLAFNVEDIAREIDAITARGATMARFPVFQQDARGIWTAPDGTKVAWFHDPDLNLLSMVQPA